MNTKQIEKRIAKAPELSGEQLDLMAEVDQGEAIRDALREDVVTNVLAELLECLKAGESLEDAIATIQENF
jgi:hypothetical protein